MHRLRIIHETSYFYREPVDFGPHAAMLRPREGHDLHIDDAKLEISPESSVRWLRDIYGNSIAVIEFEKPSEHLRVFSECLVSLCGDAPRQGIIAPYAKMFPFHYAPEEQVEIFPYRLPSYPHNSAAVQEWLSPIFRPGQLAITHDFLLELNSRIYGSFQYARREEAGVQMPCETISLGSGSCRDFAVFFMEAARLLGLAARFVTGYILIGEGQHGATHAWAEAYIPGAGWRGFDPTNNKVVGPEHVSVAVARDHEKANPLSGSWSGPAEAFDRMEVSVQVFAE